MTARSYLRASGSVAIMLRRPSLREMGAALDVIWRLMTIRGGSYAAIECGVRSILQGMRRARTSRVAFDTLALSSNVFLHPATRVACLD
jgi:hypothetical protein